MERKKNKIHTDFWLFRIDRKNISRRRRALSRQKGVVGISLYCLKKVMIPQENTSDFRSYTAKVKMPWYYNTKQRVIRRISIAALFIKKYFWRETFNQVHFLGGSVVHIPFWLNFLQRHPPLTPISRSLLSFTPLYICYLKGHCPCISLPSF